MTRLKFQRFSEMVDFSCFKVKAVGQVKLNIEMEFCLIRFFVPSLNIAQS